MASPPPEAPEDPEAPEVSSYSEIKKTLGRFFTDRVSAHESDFRTKGRKKSGMSTGYIAVKQNDPDGFTGLPFMIKTVAKSGQERNDGCEALNFVNEFVTAPLYKRTLYDRTPIIAGVESTEDGKIAFRSKFLHDFQTIAQFTNSHRTNVVGKNINKLRSVQGFEKVFASLMVWGESDIHAGNIGIMKLRNEDGEDSFVFAKVDHGWSAGQFFTDPVILLQSFAAAYRSYGYDPILPLNVDLLKQAIDQITLISVDEIESLVKSRLLELKRMGFKIEDLDFNYWEDDAKHAHSYDSPYLCSIRYDNFDALERHYVAGFMQQMGVMREVSRKLDMIASFDDNFSPDEQQDWKDGNWLDAINDPREYPEFNLYEEAAPEPEPDTDADAQRFHR